MKTTLSILAAALLAAVLAPRASHAAEDGQLWEVSSQMDMPEMPEGRQMPPGMMAAMGARKTQICRGKDPRESVTKSKDMKDCTVSDFKESANTVTMSVTCDKGRSAKMEFVYNKDRTEYKGTMHMKDKGREMTMRTSGKKIGTCDAEKAAAERTAKVEKIKAQAEASQAQYKELTAKAEGDQIKSCAKAVDAMDPERLGMWGSCYKKKDANCKTIMEMSAKQQPKVADACAAKAEEFCKRYETEAGFLKLSQSHRLDAAERLCGVSPDDLRPKLCKGASKNESFEFVGANCPEQAKPLAKAHCAGRSYTVKEGDPRRVEKKWFKFCVAVAGRYASEDDSQAKNEETEAPRPAKDAKEQAKDEAKAEAKKAAKGAAVNALKGLFGR